MKIIPIASACARTVSAPNRAEGVEGGGVATDSQAAAEWHEVGPLAQCFSKGDCYGTTIAGVKIGVFRVNDEFFALDDICTHGNALLSDGFLEGHEVECPLHAGLVDVRTGKPCAAPIVRDTRRHEVRVDDGILFVKLSA